MAADRILTRVILVLVVAFVVFGIGTPLLGSKVFLGTDIVVNDYPWRADVLPDGVKPRNPCLGDTVDSIVPGRAEFRNRAYQGDFALWDPTGSGGSALGSVPDFGVLSPLNLPYLVLPLWYAPAIGKLLEMAVSIGFMYLLLRRLGLHRASSLVGGLVFTMSGFLVMWTNWNQGHVAALIPALFWAGERYLQKRGLRAALPIAVVVAVMLLEGFPAVTAYATYAWVPYMAVRAARNLDRPWQAVARPVVLAGVMFALGAALVAFQLLPFLGHLRQLDVGYRRVYSNDHLPMYTLATFAVPDVFGSCPSGTFFGPINEIEANAFVGVGALALIVFGLGRRAPRNVARGTRSFFLGAAAVGLMLGWFGGPAFALAQKLPGFHLNFVGRIRSVEGFFLAVLAAAGFETLLRGRAGSEQPVNRARSFAVGAAAIVLASALIVGVRHYASALGHLHEVDAQLVLPAALLVISVSALAIGSIGSRAWRVVALCVFPVVALVQGLMLVVPFWPRTDRAFFYPVTPTHRFLAGHLGGDRYAAEDATMAPGTNMYYGLRSPTGHSFTATPWAQLLKAVDPKVFKSGTYSALGGATATATSPILDRMAVRYFVKPPDAFVPGRTVGGAEGTSQVRLQPGEPLEAHAGPGPLRAIAVKMLEDVTPSDPWSRLDVTVFNTSGDAVAHGDRRLGPRLQAGWFLVPIAPELAANQSGVRVRIVLRGSGTSAILATAQGGEPVLSQVVGDGDGLRLAFANGTVVYERLHSMARIRWASRARVVADAAERVRLLANPTLSPDEVVLDHSGPPAGGEGANLDVVEDSGDAVRVRVHARGDGYLVVADAAQYAWVASIDGKRVPLRAADHAFVAVAVPGGDHTVALSYDPPYHRLGLAISALSLILLGAAWGCALRFRRALPAWRNTSSDQGAGQSLHGAD